MFNALLLNEDLISEQNDGNRLKDNNFNCLPINRFKSIKPTLNNLLKYSILN